MNDTTLPPPPGGGGKGKGNDKSTTGGDDGKQQLTRPRNARPRAKIGVRRGFGLHDWMNLQRHAKDLAQRRGTPIRPSISRQEIAQHRTVHDGWISLRGKVYNVTPYLHYHPGGVEILENVLGRDATTLFDKYHRWVNLDGLVGCLLLGYLATDDEDGSKMPKKKGEKIANGEDRSIGKAATATIASTTSATSEGKGPGGGEEGDFQFAVPAPRPPTARSALPPLLTENDDDDGDDRNPWE